LYGARNFDWHRLAGAEQIDLDEARSRLENPGALSQVLVAARLPQFVGR
jgi:hypothetical protein